MFIKRLINKRLQFLSIAKIQSVPIVDTSKFLNTNEDQETCKQIADSLYKYGCVIIKDPRVDINHNNLFLDMMEKYFNDRGQLFYQNKKIQEIFPELAYQTGATPEFIERARDNKDQALQYSQENQIQTPIPAPYDAKWRYFWQIVEAGTKKEFSIPNVSPQDFPQWESRMNNWGSLMLEGCITVSKMAAIGMNLPEDTFSKLMIGGQHLLAPTGSDLERYDVGKVFAGYHYDLNFLTIHGKSRFPGLFVWLRSGQRISVAVPDGHLLLQAGKQFEILTGGWVTCGFHEVIYTQQVKQKMLEAKSKGQITWRVSSTLFSHINHDVVLRPLGKFETPEAKAKYPAITAFEQVQDELRAISLKLD